MKIGCQWLAILAGCLLAVAGAGEPSAHDPRSEAVLADGWKVQCGFSVVQPPAADGWETVTLPFCLDWSKAGWLKEVQRKHRLFQALQFTDVRNLWFERTANIPAEWAGKRILLRIDRVERDAVLFVDGVRAGDIPGEGGAVDLSDLVHPGAASVLRLYVTTVFDGVQSPPAWTAHRRHARDQLDEEEAKRKGTSLDELRRKTGGVWVTVGLGGAFAPPAGEAPAWKRNGDASFYGIPTLQALPRSGSIEDVFVKTCVRGGNRLALQCDLRTEMPIDGAAIRVRAEPLDASTGAKAFAPEPRPIASLPTGNSTVEVEWGWKDVKYWELRHPSLYALTVELVGKDGRVLDRRAPQRIGFREFWIEDRRFYMNGHEIRLIQAGFEWHRRSIQEYRDLGYNAVYVQPNPSAFWMGWSVAPIVLSAAETCDELGMALWVPAPAVTSVNLSDPLQLEGYRFATNRWLRQWRNHPSILMWCPSMNIGASPTNWSPEHLGQSKFRVRGNSGIEIANRLLRQDDPTRPVYNHQCSSGDMAAYNFYGNWIPMQEMEEWPSQWARSGDYPVGMVEWGPGPISLDWFRRGDGYSYTWDHGGKVEARVTEYAAIYRGDAAFEAEPDSYAAIVGKCRDKKLAVSLLQGNSFPGLATDVALEYTRRVHRAWRTWGISGGMMHWFFKPNKDVKDPVWDLEAELSQPLVAYLGGPADQFTDKTWSFAAGERVRKSVVIVWDDISPKTADIAWELVPADGGAPLAQGKESVALGGFAIVKHPIEFAVPAVKTRTNLRLRLAVRMDGTNVARDEFSLTVFPPLAPLGPRKAQWFVFDPEGRTCEWLSSLGIAAAELTPGQTLPPNAVCVIGRNALSGRSQWPISLATVAAGAQTLVCEQQGDVLGAMGFRVQDAVSRVAYPRVKTHPVYAGLVATDLCNWRGESTLIPSGPERMRHKSPRFSHWGNRHAVASLTLETPQAGGFTPLADGEFDLAFSPLVDWRHGRGRITFCQFDLTGRVGPDPVATRLARNLVDWLDAEAQLAKPTRRCYFAGGDAGWDFISTLGFDVQRLDAAAKDLPTDVAVVIGPGATALSATVTAAVAAHVEAGGTVVVLPQRGGFPAAWNLAFPTAEAAITRAARTIPNHPLFLGIGPQDVHWRDAVKLPLFAPPSVQSKAISLMDGLFLDVARGRGRFFLSAFDPAALDRKDDWSRENIKRSVWHVRRLYAQILANVGVESASAVSAAIGSLRVAAPLRPTCEFAAIGPFPCVKEMKESTELQAYDRLIQMAPGEVSPLAFKTPVDDPLIRKRSKTGVECAGRKLVWTRPWWASDDRRGGQFDMAELWGGIRLKSLGYAVTQVWSTREREAAFDFGADWWSEVFVNGESVFARPNGNGMSTAYGNHRFRAKLHAGWNELLVKVAGGGSGFCFYLGVSDPGDLHMRGSLETPGSPPDNLPRAESLLPEPSEMDVLYATTLVPSDDPYWYCAW
jgi:beta-galactosidase